MIRYISTIIFFGIFSLGNPSLLTAGELVDWEKLNPNLRGAISVGKTKECLLCHEDYIKAFEKTKHARIYRAKFGKELGSSCENCHGPLSKHLAETNLEKKFSTVVSFRSLDSNQKNQICLQCHEKGFKMNWKGSNHEMSGVSCTKCHYVMKKKSKRHLFIFEDSKKLCFQCHRDKRAKLLRTSHMPLREGKMHCASCHNPHGGPGPSQLKKATVNETCYMCHQEKRGPLIWEHPPVRENCSNCHDPHGSNFRPLLKRKPPFLCQECHMDAFHPSTVYDRGTLRSRSQDLVGKSCLNCHSLIHGSNHPSGARFQR